MNVLLTRILYSVTPGPTMIRAVCEYSRLILITVVIFVLLRFPSKTPKLNCNQTIAVSWDEHLENLVSIQHLYCKKNTPFRSEIMRYNDLEQTNTFFLRENRNQNTSNSANAICLHVAWIRTDECSRISRLFSVILNSLLRILFHVFYSSHSVIRLTMFGFARS